MTALRRRTLQNRPMRLRTGWVIVLAGLLTALASSCGGDSASSSPFRNPVYDADFPDPFVLRVDDTFYAYGTNSAGLNVQTLTSTDLVRWHRGADALPKLGRWAYSGKTWAPEVLARTDGTFVLYYTANAAEFGAQCIGRAEADTPTGPFVDSSSAPLVCQKAEGGSIDPSPFRDDDGRLYLLWKNDGNCCNEDTWIYSQRLSRDGLTLTGRRARLVRQDADWEASVVEAPTLWREEDGYFLFFSGNAFDSDLYAVGYATCQGPLGPCSDAADNPVLKSACGASGPGHQALLRHEGNTWIAYHAYPADGGDERVLWLDRVSWADGRPDVAGPTCEPQPSP